MMDPKLPENPLAISWHDSNWIPVLTPHNVMDYFSERSNPFYERTCNNEVLKMQRASMDQLQNMTGVEFCLLHVQDPILYVVRKQHRSSPSSVTPLADYYIIAGTVYQAPDLGSVLNSRLVSTVNHLQQAFEEAKKYATYHPSRGYWWDFEKGKRKKPGVGPLSAMAAMGGADKAKEDPAKAPSKKKKAKSIVKEVEKRAREEPSSLFQRHRVDMLLDLLTRRFPAKTQDQESSQKSEVKDGAGDAASTTAAAATTTSKEGDGSKTAVKSEPGTLPPPSTTTTASASTSGIKREGGPVNAQQVPKKPRMGM